VRVLVDIIMPKDDRSGSATDAGVPEFMNFMMGDPPNRQTAMRGGLAWIDLECQDRYDNWRLPALHIVLDLQHEQYRKHQHDVIYNPSEEEERK
jgi:hypothetical protein